MSSLARLWRSEWLAVRVQIGLGAVFLVASLPKLGAPPVFAKNVLAYDILPDALVNIMAALLPGIEFSIGLALILGMFRRPAAAICGALLLVFIVALSWNVMVGNPVNCSCFDLNAPVKTCAELLSEMKGVILRDLAVLLLVAHVLLVAPGRSVSAPDQVA